MSEKLDKLRPEHFRRLDEGDDADFYKQPRLVTHIDDPACSALNDYFRTQFPANSELLDLMSSCVSHLPWDMTYKNITGLGMNEVELNENPQLTKRVVHNLSKNPTLPFANHSFDGCMITVSVQYIIHPIKVFTEIARVLRPGAACIVSFSNRCFPTKAVAIWHHLDDQNHGKLVEYYFEKSNGFDKPETHNISPNPGQSDPLFIVQARASSL